jgi:hypothetical protein
LRHGRLQTSMVLIVPTPRILRLTDGVVASVAFSP